MILTLSKAYLILFAWIFLLVTASISFDIMNALTGSSSFEKEYTIERLGWLQEGLLVLVILLVALCWWPLLATKTKESARFFLISLMVLTALIFSFPYLINGIFWVLSGGTWDPEATDSGIGVAAFLLYILIPIVMTIYLVTGLVIRKRSLKH